MILVCARMGLMIMSAKVIMVAAAALSSVTPMKMTTVSRTAKMNVVVAMEIRKTGDQMPVLMPRMVHTPSTR